MTGKHACPFPRLVLSGFCNFVGPLLRKGRRESRAPTAPVVPCASACYRHAHVLNHRYSQDIPAFPTQWLYGLYVLSPGKRPFLPPFCGSKLPQVAPGSRRQDHTISPYAVNVSSGAETPDATASIATRANVP